MKKLFLLDAYALIFRSYYAFINNPRYNSKGVNTSAIFGFTNTLDEVLRKEAPTHIAVVFDPPPPTFRHKMFDQYKANRQSTPEDIRKAVPYIKRIIDGYNIPIIQVDGFEADDVIGTLAKKFEKEGFTVYMMTPDKDYSQLVSDHIFVYKPRTNGNSADILGKPEVKRDFLVDQPELVADILALWGDASDNIPGAPGIGEKTAKKLVSEFGSVENIIANAQKLKGKQKDIILNNQEVIALSKKLTSIVLDVPVEISEKELEKVNMDRVKLQEIFDELEFKNLANRILNSGIAAKASVIQGSLFPEETPQELTVSVASSLKTIKDIEHSYFLVNEKAEREKLIGLLKGQKEFCFDTETTGLDPHSAELVGISFCFQALQAWYLPVPENREEALNLLKEFKGLFENEKIRKVGQNIKFDILMLKDYGIEVKGEIFDTMIAHYLIQPELRHNMNYLSEIYLHYDPVHIESLIGKAGKDQKSMRQVPVETIKEYCCEDSDVTYQLKEILEKELKEKAFIELAEKVEFPLIYTLAQMEWNGMKLDVPTLS
ncbi:MAG: 5'-3' exonuclease H3TH domain-containing protein, partial [Bacteroidota bacterium]|nr:5'-3' exonuclease H3TH domain-containing protein [Bacteroidota bacterium]